MFLLIFESGLLCKGVSSKRCEFKCGKVSPLPKCGHQSLRAKNMNSIEPRRRWICKMGHEVSVSAGQAAGFAGAKRSNFTRGRVLR